MKTKLQILNLENPALILKRGIMAMMLVLFTSMAFTQNTVVNVIVNSDDHTILETAVIAAELDDDLAGTGPFTVFAPTDAAFNALPAGTLASLLEDPTGALAQILLYHVVGSQIVSSELADGQVVTTLNGDSITITFQEGSFYVDNAKITGTDIHTDNGVVHVIDAVILPKSTVVDIIVGSPDHTTLEAAVIAAELADDLSGEGPFTVFAPTDAAFDALPAGTVASLLEDPTGALAQILLYHVVAAKALSTDLSDGQMITTMNGDSVTVKIMDGNVYIDDAMVTSADLMADNGVVHVIDAVILPKSTVVDIIVGSPDHTILEAAVIAAELADDLSGEGPFTVFAPTDAAFDALPAGTVASLLEDPTGALAQILLYHVVAAKALSTDLSDGQMITTMNGDSVTVKIMDGNVYIDDAMVTSADLMADNGVVHVIDAVILPKSTVVDIIVGSPDHTILEAAVIAAELADDLAGEGPFTVFAPTDAAFDALPAGTVASLLEDPTGALAQILLYHVVAAKALSTDLSDGQMITTMNGDSVTVKIMDGNVYIDDAMVTTADLMADNGVVHVIDAVILPKSTVVDIIVGSPDHTILEAAVIAAELADDLAGEGPFTVFAPTDAAFDALPAGTVASLLEDPTGALAQILLYHVVAAKALSTDLSDGQMITTMAGSDVMVTISDGDVFINDAKVIAADIETDNGVVHVIDAVILPSTTGIREMIIESADVSVFPNPASEFVSVKFEVLSANEISLEMYDMLGQQVRIQKLGYINKGSHTAELSVGDLESGMYLFIINTGNSQIANKVRVVK